MGLFVPACFASDPTTLRVDVIGGKALSFELENHYSEPVTKFEVAAGFGENLGCSIAVDVKRTEDLHPQGVCGLPIDKSTGNVADMKWKARIVYVEFADGMRWTPKK